MNMTSDQLTTFALLEKSLDRTSNRDDLSTALSVLNDIQARRIDGLQRELENKQRQLEGFHAFFSTTRVRA